MIHVNAMARLTGLLLLFACAEVSPPQTALVPRTPRVCTVPPDGAPQISERGIGGTGAPTVRAAERGIGGTGSPSTGVVGTITGFASICVNGLEIAYDPTGEVEIDGQMHPMHDLRIGQVVTAQATTDHGPDGLTAERLSVRHAVSGPIEAVVTPGQLFVVAAQRVQLGPRSPGAEALTVGDWIAVSGLRDLRQTINATRLDRRAAGGIVLTGRLQIGPDGARIAATRLTGPVPPSLHGQTVTVTGAYRDGTLRVATLQPALPPVSLGTAGTVVIETYVQAEGDHLVLGDGQPVAAAASLGALPAAPGLAVMVLAQSADGALTALSMHDGKGDGAPSGTAPALAPHAPAITQVGTAAPGSNPHGAAPGSKNGQTSGDPSGGNSSPSAAKK